MMERMIHKKSHSTKPICFFSMLNEGRTRLTTWPMPSIFTTAGRMRNTMGSGKWVDTSSEATVWEILIVVLYTYISLIFLPAPIMQQTCCGEIPTYLVNLRESSSLFLTEMQKFMFMIPRKKFPIERIIRKWLSTCYPPLCVYIQVHVCMSMEINVRNLLIGRKFTYDQMQIPHQSF